MCSLSHLYDQKHIYFLTVRYQASSAAAWEPLVLFYYKHGSSVLLSDGFIVGSARLRRRVDSPLTSIRAVNDVHTILLYSILGQSQHRHPQMEPSTTGSDSWRLHDKQCPWPCTFDIRMTALSYPNRKHVSV
jgi:hypothetical protein